MWANHKFEYDSIANQLFNKVTEFKLPIMQSVKASNMGYFA
ncbi:TPA: hypothetical protein ACRZ6V_004944 [Vibrio harveyi]